MSKEFAYLEYLLNPPVYYERGQIWKNPYNGLEFLITSTINDKIVRAVVLTTSSYLRELNDISLKDDMIAKNVFGRERFVLRITDGPVPTEQLISYCGRVEEETLKKIMESLKDENFSYDEAQNILIAELLDSLQPLRERALDLEEVEEGEVQILSIKNIQTQEIYNQPLRLAAKDFSTEEEEIEFWRKERETKDKVEIPVNIPELICRFSLVDDFYYLVLITDKYDTIEKIKITENEEEFLELHNINISKTKRYCYILTKKLSDEAVYKIEIVIKGSIYKSYLMFNYE